MYPLAEEKCSLFPAPFSLEHGHFLREFPDRIFLCTVPTEIKSLHYNSIFHVHMYMYSTRKIVFQNVAATFADFNPQQNDQGRKGPCFFQRLIALKCLKCQKIKKNI
jgi:hypothetical protein